MAAMLCLVCSCTDGRRAPPVAVDGIIDLSDWDFGRDGMVELQGEWRFTWAKFVEPMPIEQFRNLNPMTMNVPGRWSHLLEDEQSKSQGQLGYATYALEIRLPPKVDTRTLAF